MRQLNVRVPERSYRLAERLARRKDVPLATFVDRLINDEVKRQAKELQHDLDTWREEAKRQEELLAQDVEEALRQ